MDTPTPPEEAMLDEQTRLERAASEVGHIAIDGKPEDYFNGLAGKRQIPFGD